MPPTRRVAVIGCRDLGGLAILFAITNPHDVIAGFDADRAAVAAARRAAARHGVADRVTFEQAAPNRFLGGGYDLVVHQGTVIERGYRVSGAPAAPEH